MTLDRPISEILSATHPYDALSPTDRDQLAQAMARVAVAAGTAVQRIGDAQDALYLIVSGQIDISDEAGQQVSILGPGNSFGERGLLRDGAVVRDAIAAEDSVLLSMPAAVFHDLMNTHAAVRRFL